MTAGAPSARAPGRGTLGALMFGNFVIGCGVMVVPGSLNDIVRALAVSVAAAGQLISIAAVTMCVGAPLAAALAAGWDRRRLLAATMLWYAIGHALCAFAPALGALLPLRAATVLGAAVFTPQAAAAVGTMVEPARRGQAITFVFLGWSLASVIGMPVHAYIGEAFGWRYAFALVALLALVSAAWTWRAMPDGVKPPALSLASWRRIFGSPVLVGLVAVTALSGAGQFTLFSYFAPYFRQVLGASAGEVSLLFGWFGLFGLAGNVLLTRLIDRTGAARAVAATLTLIALSLAAWPLASTPLALAIVIVPWALGCFASNSAQQARAGIAEPALAPALIALNTSAIYLGQAVGADGGGAIVAASGYAPLPWVGLAWLAAAIALSAWVAARMKPAPAAAHG